MSGGGGGVIIIKNLKAAASLGVTTSGRYKVWHVLVLTHLVAWAVGKFV